MAALKHEIDAALGRHLAAEPVAAWPATSLKPWSEAPRRRYVSRCDSLISD
jgi:hypothetical protein